jgi:hemolysin III
MLKQYHLTGEDIANAVTPGIGLLLSLAGLCVLVILAVLRGTALEIVSCSVYGTSLVLCNAASTLYHGFRNPRIKHFFHVLDHCSIYLLIAGTYTPFTLVVLHNLWGWILFGIIWGLSLLGIFFKIFWINRFKVLSVSVYLLMGWMAIVAIKPLVTMVPVGGVLWIVAGGLAYSVGVVFYAWKKLPYSHAIWHIFVLGGSACHFFAVLFYVLPGS